MQSNHSSSKAIQLMAEQLATEERERPAIRDAGIAALKRLIPVAQRTTGQSRIVGGFLLSLYDLSKGPGVQVVKNILLSSPDHRGATGPMLFGIDLAIEFVGRETVKVAAGKFEALHFRFVDIPGLLLEHPPYDLWCTDDGEYVLLKAQVGGYMQTAYELTAYDKTGEGI